MHPSGSAARTFWMSRSLRGENAATMTEIARPAVSTSPRPHRLLRWVAGVALLTGMGSALAGAGAGVLNAVATLRGHQGRSDVAYGPLERQRFDIYRPGDSVDQADRITGSPLVIFIYGGSWNMGSRRDYRFAG